MSGMIAIERELAADRPHEVLEAEERYEVGDNPTAEEMERREEAKRGNTLMRKAILYASSTGATPDRL